MIYYLGLEGGRYIISKRKTIKGQSFEETQINGIENKKSITSVTKTFLPEDNLIGEKLVLNKLDELGCIKSVQIESRTDKDSINVRKIYRDSRTITISECNTSWQIQWDGNPACLNQEEPTEEQIRNNVDRAIKKYPELRTVYEKYGFNFEAPSWGEFGDK